MTDWVAALPMYDWPERRAEVDAEWASIRDTLRADGVDAPEALTRGFDDLHELWLRPNLLFAQTCWGPMEQGLSEHVQVVGQPDYSAFKGGAGEFYSSALVMRRDGGDAASDRRKLGSSDRRDGLSRPDDVSHGLPLGLMRNARFAYSAPDSMSGMLAVAQDLEAAGETLSIFAQRIETGGHRFSIKAVADGRADIAAIDGRSWALAEQFEPAARSLQVVGWTQLRTGLPYITAKRTPPDIVHKLRNALARAADTAWPVRHEVTVRSGETGDPS